MCEAFTIWDKEFMAEKIIKYLHSYLYTDKIIQVQGKLIRNLAWKSKKINGEIMKQLDAKDKTIMFLRIIIHASFSLSTHVHVHIHSPNIFNIFIYITRSSLITPYPLFAM